MTAALLDHLWQSTLVAALAALLALALHNNSARVRFWLWFAASMKFLVPFAALAALGESLARLLPVTLTAPTRLLAIAPAAERISAPAALLAVPEQAAGVTLALLLGLVWALGTAAVLGVQLVRSLRLRRLLKDARDVKMSAPVPPFVKVKTSTSLLEPGLVGILNPVVLLPQGLLGRLSPGEIQSILAHELTHLRRRDNLTAAVHMLVEALFWFYPLVWVIGSRLIAERERACDEGVLARGHDREVYAGGILKVCKFCLQSPLACASGVSGGNLGLRVRQIMTAPDAQALAAPKKLMLAGTAMLMLALPVMAGLVAAPLPQAIQQVRTVAAAADQAIGRGLEAIGLPLGALPVPAPERLPQLKMTRVAAPVAELPSFTVAAWQPQGAPAVAPPPGSVGADNVVVKNATVTQVAGNTPSPARQAVKAINPRGEGDPNAITCRVPQQMPGSRLRGPEVCQPNKVWAAFYANHLVMLPDGKAVVATGWQSEACSSARIAGVPSLLLGGTAKTAYRCSN
jgi:beta-lactamase regulating signal transducer with metallopeptidase domain